MLVNKVPDALTFQPPGRYSSDDYVTRTEVVVPAGGVTDVFRPDANPTIRFQVSDAQRNHFIVPDTMKFQFTAVTHGDAYSDTAGSGFFQSAIQPVRDALVYGDDGGDPNTTLTGHALREYDEEVAKDLPTPGFGVPFFNSYRTTIQGAGQETYESLNVAQGQQQLMVNRLLCSASAVGVHRDGDRNKLSLSGQAKASGGYSTYERVTAFSGNYLEALHVFNGSSGLQVGQVSMYTNGLHYSVPVGKF